MAILWNYTLFLFVIYIYLILIVMRGEVPFTFFQKLNRYLEICYCFQNNVRNSLRVTVCVEIHSVCYKKRLWLKALYIQ